MERSKFGTLASTGCYDTSFIFKFTLTHGPNPPANLLLSKPQINATMTLQFSTPLTLLVGAAMLAATQSTTATSVAGANFDDLEKHFSDLMDNVFNGSSDAPFKADLAENGDRSWEYNITGDPILASEDLHCSASHEGNRTCYVDKNPSNDLVVRLNGDYTMSHHVRPCVNSTSTCFPDGTVRSADCVNSTTTCESLPDDRSKYADTPFSYRCTLEKGTRMFTYGCHFNANISAHEEGTQTRQEFDPSGRIVLSEQITLP